MKISKNPRWLIAAIVIATLVLAGAFNGLFDFAASTEAARTAAADPGIVVPMPETPQRAAPTVWPGTSGQATIVSSEPAPESR